MKNLPKLWALKRAVRQFYPVKVPQPKWEELLGEDFNSWKSLASRETQTGQRILLVSTVGAPTVTTVDSLLAVALTLRGAEVDILICDGALPACQASWLDRLQSEKEFVKHGPQRDLCPSCFSSGYDMYRSLGIKVHRYSQFLSEDDYRRAESLAASIPLDEIPQHTVDGIPVGEHALAGAIRFYARGGLEREEYGEAVLRRYMAASLLTMYASNRLFNELDYSCVSANHGIYVPQGVICAVAKQKGARIVNWAIGYRKNSFIFSHDDTYHHTLMTEPVSNWINMNWDEEMESDLLKYLKSRWSGANDWISYSKNAEADRNAISKEVGVDFSKPCIGLLTNVVWDAQLHYPQNAFPNMLDWLMVTIRYFAERPDLQLVIRVHPAEVQAQIQSRQPVVEEIKRAFPDLPGNIFIIPPESAVSTYAVMMQCDSVLIYGTKAGVELTSFGVPVIVAGEAWIRNKGITADATSSEHYMELLEKLPLGERLSEEIVRRARKYAYHFFFRRTMPLKVIQPVNAETWWAPYEVQISGLNDLLPGNDPGLDAICDGILHGREFIYPAERLGKPSDELATAGVA
ncbi:MAG: capsule biosynthesis protein [Acidobacteria bacterium]|nr:capsule biosynthesis protein [Acidobacteriota bacterium]